MDISEDIQLWTSNYCNQSLKNCDEVFDYAININMIHITPFDCSIGLFKNVSFLLKPKGLLFTYGPYSVNNILTPESNANFDKSLRRQNPLWGVRDIDDLVKAAEINSMRLSGSHDLPSNNKLLVWSKV